MNKKIKIIPVLEVEVRSESIIELQAEVSRLRQLADAYAQECYYCDDESTNTAIIGFCTENPEILEVILRN